MIGSGENDPVVPHKPVQQGGGGVILGWHTSLRWRHDDPHGGTRIAGRGGWAGQRCHGPQRGSASLEGVLERGSWAAATFHRGLEQWLAGVPSDLPQDRRAEGRRRRGRIPVGSEGKRFASSRTRSRSCSLHLQTLLVCKVGGLQQMLCEPGQCKFWTSTGTVSAKYCVDSGQVLGQFRSRTGSILIK